MHLTSIVDDEGTPRSATLAVADLGRALGRRSAGRSKVITARAVLGISLRAPGRKQRTGRSCLQLADLGQADLHSCRTSGCRPWRRRPSLLPHSFISTLHHRHADLVALVEVRQERRAARRRAASPRPASASTSQPWSDLRSCRVSTSRPWRVLGDADPALATHHFNYIAEHP